MIAAISKSGVVHSEIILHSVTRRGVCTSDIKAFLYNLAPSAPQGSCLILDNASLHHSDELEPCWNTISIAHNISYKFLPPYSPFLNPIELLFSVLKSKLRKMVFDKTEDLVDAVTSFMKDVVTPTLCESWFEHSSNFILSCLACMPYDGTMVPTPSA